MIYEVFFYDGTGVPPDATIAPECTQYRESPADVAVACFFGPAPVFGSSPPVEQFVFTPRSEGTYRIRLTAVAGERQVDVKPENNVLEDLRSVGFAQADVRLESLETTTVDPTVGQLVEVRAELGNLGPDASRSHGLVRYIIFGDVELGFFPSNCELAAASSFGPTLRCELAPLEPGETELNLRMEFTPRAAGDLTITAVVDSSGFFTLDPDGSNNIKSLTIAVAAAGPGS